MNTHLRMRSTTLLLALTVLPQCKIVGEDYEEPDTTAVQPTDWNQDLPEGLVQGGDPEQLADWWRTLEDPLLTSYIQQAIDGNRDLRATLARIRQVRAARRIAGASLMPRVGGSGALTESQNQLGNNTMYSAGFDASWEIDLFGGLQRGVEAAEADLAAAEQSVLDVLVSMTSEVALHYVEIRSFQERLRIANRNAQTQSETLIFVQSREEAGLVDRRDVEQARSNLRATRARIPSLEAGLTRARNSLSVLLGKSPGAVDEEIAEPKALPTIPPSVAVGVPAEMLRRRPDVRAAERTLAAETARIGVAEAELYPKLTLDGSIGIEAASASGLFSNPTDLFSVGPRLSWNVFDFGRTRGRIEQQEAVAEEALALYEGTILRALEDVEGAIVEFGQEKIRQVELEAAVESANESLILARDQYRAGLIDFVVVLDAERSVLNLEDEEQVSLAATVSNLVRLYKALGGGWQAIERVDANEAAREAAEQEQKDG